MLLLLLLLTLRSDHTVSKDSRHIIIGTLQDTDKLCWHLHNKPLHAAAAAAAGASCRSSSSCCDCSVSWRNSIWLLLQAAHDGEA
jgi:hypothetical protein